MVAPLPDKGTIMAEAQDETLIALTADIVAAHVSNNTVASNDIADLIARVHGALSGLGEPAPAPEVELKPAVALRSSVKPDHIVCLEDGAKLKMLKRHLATHHNMTPAAYRAKWKLPADYPLVAPNYAAQRKSLALKIGLGRKPVEAGTAAKSAAEKPAAKRKLSVKFAEGEPASNPVPPKRAARKKADAPAA